MDDDLASLIAQAGARQRILEEARAKMAEAQKVIDTNISEFVATKNRISWLINDMIEEATNADK